MHHESLQWSRRNIGWELINAFDDRKTCQNSIYDEIKKITASNDVSDLMYKVDGNNVLLLFFFQKIQ